MMVRQYSDWAIGLTIEGMRFESCQQQKCVSSHRIKTALEDHPTHPLRILGAPSVNRKHPSHEANHSHLVLRLRTLGAIPLLPHPSLWQRVE